MSSLRPHGPTCPAPVRTLVEHKRDVVGIDPPRPTQLEGWFPPSKNHPTPVGAGVLTRPPLSQHPPTKVAWIPTDVVQYSTHSTAVAQKGPRVVQTQAAGNRRIAQSLSPKEYPSRVGALYGCTVARNHFHWSTFSFSESRTAFSFADKRKSGFGPRWASGKTIPSRAGKK